MEVNKAQAFLAVADELHFGRAAKKLHMAQPPLSRLIRNLEKEMGAQLFERNTRQVNLTPQGEALVEPARELVMMSERMKTYVRNSAAGETGRIKLGFGEASVNQVVGDFARKLAAERPGISLELYNSQFGILGIDKILDGSLDLLIGRWDFLPPEVDSYVIEREELLIALPDNHPLTEKSAVTAEELAEEPWVVLPGGTASLPNRFNRISESGDFVPRVVQIGPDSATLLLLVGARIGLALTLSSVRDNLLSRGVAFRPLAPAPAPVDVRLIWPRKRSNPAVATAVRMCKRMFADPRGSNSRESSSSTTSE